MTGAAPRPDSLRTGQNRQNMANRNEVEEQNAIDKLNTNLSEASEKIAQNKKVIFWTVGGLAVVAAFVLSYFSSTAIRASTRRTRHIIRSRSKPWATTP